MSQEFQVAGQALVPAQQRDLPEVGLSEDDRQALKRAVRALESPSFAARLSALAGRPIELLGQALPHAVSEVISTSTQAALTRALHYALRTIPKESADRDRTAPDPAR